MIARPGEAMKQPVQRRPAAILAADVAGYSRLIGEDEEGTHERLKAHLSELVDPKISEHSGLEAGETRRLAIRAIASGATRLSSEGEGGLAGSGCMGYAVRVWG
jgi:class 3 adenylate cyclase